MAKKLLAHPALQIRQTGLRVGVARRTIRGAPERIELGDVRAIGVERIFRRTTFGRSGGIHAARESLELRRHLGGLALDQRDLLLERGELALEHRDALRVSALELRRERHRLGVVDPRRKLAAPAHGGELGALALELRTRRAELFQRGDYRALRSDSPGVCAFLRGDDVLVAVPRLTTRITKPGATPVGDVWGDATLPIETRGTFRNIFTGELLELSGGPVRVAQILATFPVAILERQPA